MKRNTWTKSVGILVCVCLLATVCFALLYQYDNKYTARAALTQENVTMIDKKLQKDSQVLWLVDGWKLWPDQVFLPKGPNAPGGISLYIGQYFSLSAFHADASPHGVATWQLRLQGEGTYALLLPEVFCASAVYLDGVLLGGTGSLSPYRPLVKDLVLPITLNGESELVIQTANYSHYYSGITYPPALGSLDALHLRTTIQLLFYGFLCFSALSIALFSMALWLGSADRGEAKRSFWFGLLALSFSLRICYPFVRGLGLPIIAPLYALEDAMAMLGIVCALRLSLWLSGLDGHGLAKAALLLALGFVALGALAPTVILPLLPAFAAIYGQLVFWYKLLSALLMLAVSFYGVGRGYPHSGWLLSGFGIYSLSLFAHMLCLGQFEPAYTGWQDEWGAYVLVLCFALLMVRRNFAVVREHARLRDHLREEVEETTKNLSTLLQERRQLLSGFAHDMKTPMSSMNTFVRLVEEGGVGLDEETSYYLGAIRRKVEELGEHLEKLQDFATQDAPTLTPEDLDLSVLLREFHASNLPDMEVAGVNFLLHCPRQEPVKIRGDRALLLRVLQNLAYNALSFTPPNGSIRFSLHKEEREAVLFLCDTGAGIAPQDLPHIFERLFTQREDDSGEGLGLYLAKSIIQEHGGSISASSEEGRGSTFTIRLPLQ